jgi:peptidoglycan/LPS O-acetylase OafA/YrhL
MGAIRFMLALGVILQHTSLKIMPAVGAVADFRLTLGISGAYSVLWFYVVSGFLMSTVLSQKYSTDFTGTLQFYKSRFLRIYPLWWVIFLFCALVVMQGQQPRWSSLHSISDYLYGMMLFGQDWRLIFSSYPDQNWQIFPPASDVGWTLSAEITFYMIAPFVLRSLRWSVALFVASLAVRALVCLLTDPSSSLHITWNYFFFPSTLCFFLLGHLGRVASSKLRIPVPIGYTILLLSFVLSFQLANAQTFDNAWLYGAIALFGLALPTLFAATKDSRVSNFFGDLTYPIYLVGNICLNAILATWSGLGGYGMWILTVAKTFSDPHTRGLVITALVLLFVVPVAIATHFIVERPAILIVRRALEVLQRGLVAATGDDTERSTASSRKS